MSTIIATFTIGALQTLPTIATVAQQPGWVPVAAALGALPPAPGAKWKVMCTAGPGSVVNALMYIVCGPPGGPIAGYSPAIPLPPMTIGGACVAAQLFSGLVGSLFVRPPRPGLSLMPSSWQSFAAANPNLNVAVQPATPFPQPGQAALGAFFALASGESGPCSFQVSLAPQVSQ
ncbi:MAG: hypothetical protein ACLQVI_22055 [Polyangiaceae bacterium]